MRKISANPCEAYWNDIKNISKWMYKNNNHEIDENNCKLIIKKTDFINIMVQAGLINVYEKNGINYISFSTEILIDYLIARLLFDDINEKDLNEQIKIISDKIKHNSSYNYIEAIIIGNNGDGSHCFLTKRTTYLWEKFKNNDIITISLDIVEQN